MTWLIAIEIYLLLKLYMKSILYDSDTDYYYYYYIVSTMYHSCTYCAVHYAKFPMGIQNYKFMCGI